MSAVLIHGHRFEVPEGWCVVIEGDAETGDKSLVAGQWVNVEGWQTGDCVDSDEFTCVIRRDPKEKAQ